MFILTEKQHRELKEVMKNLYDSDQFELADQIHNVTAHVVPLLIKEN